MTLDNQYCDILLSICHMALRIPLDCSVLLYYYSILLVVYLKQGTLCEGVKTSSSTRHRSLRPQSRELSALDHQEPTLTCVSQPVYPGLPFTRLSAQLWCETQTAIVKTGVERSGASAHFLRLLGSGLGNTWGRNAEGTDRTRATLRDDGFRPRWEFGKPDGFEPFEWLKILALDGYHNGAILTFVQPRRFRSIKLSVTPIWTALPSRGKQNHVRSIPGIYPEPAGYGTGGKLTTL